MVMTLCNMPSYSIVNRPYPSSCMQKTMHRHRVLAFLSAFPNSSCKFSRGLCHQKCKRPSGNVPRMVAAENVPTKIDANKYQFDLRPAGPAGLTMTEVTLGTMTFGEQNSEEEAHAQLDVAYERGVVGIDIAELYPVPPRKETYSLTEKFVGSWIRKRGGPAFREKLVIFSKVAGSSGGGRALPHIRGGDRKVDRKNIRRAVESTLQRLGTDYLDLYQIHWPDRYVPIFGAHAYDVRLERNSVSYEEQIAAMDELIKEGKIRNYGLSNESAWGVSQFDAVARASGYARPVSVQNAYNLIYRDFEGHMAEACAPNNADVPLLAYSPLAGGALTGKYLDQSVPERARFLLFPYYMKRFQSSLVNEAIMEYRKVADEAGLTLTQLSLAWCKSRWFVRSTIIGATTVKQLEDNLDSFSIDLDDSIVEEVNKIYARYRDPSKLP